MIPVSALGLQSAFSNVESIPMLNETNFSGWKEHLLLVLALMDLDVSLTEERPDASKHIDETKQWDRSNRVSMMMMKFRIPQELRGVVPEDVTTAKEYLAAVEKCYSKNEKSEPIMVGDNFSSMRKEGDEGIREYMYTKKLTVAAALKKLGMDIPDDVLASVILDCLPSEYDPIKKNCRAAHKKWSTHELISQCVNYEECLKLKKKNQALAASKVMSGTKRKSSED